MIRAYPQSQSVLPGHTLVLHVSTDAPQFHVDFYRVGTTLVSFGDLGQGWLPGIDSPLHKPDEDWGVDSPNTNARAWADYNFAIPDDWPSAVYIAVCTEGDGEGGAISAPDISTSDARDSKALFVLRSPSPGAGTSILYKVPIFTYQAYNELGDPQQSLYTGAAVVSLRRPGGGTGGRPWDAFAGSDYSEHPDFYDLWNPGPPQTNSPRQTFAHWDAKFIAWMERNGYQAEYCTDLDLHEDSGAFLSSYGLLLSVGHDEYWTQQMRDNVAAFIQGGGNVAFFSGNTCWKRIDFVDAGNTQFYIGGYWWQLNKPENPLIGVSYRNGGGQWDGPRPRGLGYTVQNDHSWFYRFTNLNNGDVLGDYYRGNPNDPAALVGYECDGAFLDRSLLGKDSLQATHEDDTLANFVILGWADVSGWTDYSYVSGKTGNRVATMGFYINRGTLFNAATTDWARVLDSGKATKVERITRNVLTGLSRIDRVPTPVGIAGFFSSDDNFSHAIVASASGDISEVFYSLKSGQGLASLTTLLDAVAVGGFFSNDDNFRHAVVGTSDGNVTEVFYNPQQGQGQVVLTNLPGIIGLAAFYSSDQSFRHVIVATEDGNITEVYYHPRIGQGQALLTNLPGVVGVGAFYSEDDHLRRVVVAIRDGTIREIFYHPGQGIFFR